MEAVGFVCRGPAPQILCLCHVHRHSLYHQSPCSRSGTWCCHQAPLMLFTWMQPAQFSSTLSVEEWLEVVTIHHWLTSFPPTEPILGHGFSRTSYVCFLLGSTTLQSIHQFIYVSCVIILFIHEPASSRSYPPMSLMKSLLFLTFLQVITQPVFLPAVSFPNSLS